MDSIEKIQLWHSGKRKLNVNACSIEKLMKYSEFCKSLGYQTEYDILQTALINKTASIPDFMKMTSEERQDYLKNKLKLKDNETDVYCYPKTKTGWNEIAKAFLSYFNCDMTEKKQRLSEWEFDKENFGGEFGLLYDDGAFNMELDFACIEFIELENELQIACCKIDWDVDK